MSASMLCCPVCRQPLQPGASGEASCSSCTASFRMVVMPGATLTLPAETVTHSPADPGATVGYPADRGGEPRDDRAPPGYEILGELGRGGMGVVYRARQVGLNRLCALKMILAGGHAGEADLARFRTEAEAIARLQHGNIVTVYEVGTYEGKPFLSLEFCSGGSLDRKLNSTPIDPREAAKLVKTLAEAMQAAHDAKVIHRDLKPANVLLATDGTPKITDFGLAKKLDDVSGQTQTGAIMGTPSYMAPEQAEGKKDVGRLADVYALGAILYDCLTGRPPFRAATSFDTILQVVNQEPVPVTQLNARVPRDLETIVLKCLQKEGRRRYGSAGELAGDLGRYLNGEPIVASPVGAVERGLKWVWRNKVVSALGACVLLALLAGVAVSSWFAFQAGEEAKAARGAEADAREKKTLADLKATAAQRAEKKAEEQLLRAEWLVYAGRLSLAQSAFAEEKPALAIEYLNQCRWDLCGWEHRLLWTRFNSRMTLRAQEFSLGQLAYSPDGTRIIAGSGGGKSGVVVMWDAATGQEILTLRGHFRVVKSVGWSPDGKRILTGSEDGKTKVRDAQKGQELLVLEGAGHPAAYRPDGRNIVTGSDEGKTLKVWDVSSGKEVRTLKGHTDNVICVAYNPEGTRIVSGSRDGTLKLWDVEKGQELLTLKGHPGDVLSVAYSPGGRWFVSAGADKMPKVWDASSGKEVLTLVGHKDNVASVAYSPDGKYIVTGSGKTVKVWDAEKGTEIHVLKGHTGDVTSVAFSPDGRRLLTGGQDLSVKVWDAEKGQKGLTLSPPSGGVSGAVFSPDSKRILIGTGNNTAEVRDAETDRELLLLKGHPRSAVVQVTYSADGTGMLTGSRDGTVTLWNAEKGREILTLKGHTRAITGVAFSPDGKRMVTCSLDNTAKVWDAQKGMEVLSLKGYMNSACWSPDGKRILIGCRDNTAKVWDADNGTELLTLKGHSEWVTSAAWSPDGKRILTGSEDETAKVWDAQNGQEFFTLKGHTDFVSSASFSPDGKRILTGSWDKTVKLWDAEKGIEVLTLKGHRFKVTSVAFSPDGKRIITGSGGYGRQPGEAKIWDAEKGQEVLALKGHTREVTSACFSPDGKRILTGSEDQTAKVWDARNGQEVFTLDGSYGVEIGVFSPDGNRILTGGRGVTAKVWDAEKGHEVLSLRGHVGELLSVAYSSDGKRILTGSKDRTAKVWDAEKGQELLTLQGHTEGVTSACFSPDGRRLASGSEDKTLKVWDAKTGQELLTLRGHTAGVQSMAFSPDGSRLVSGSEDKTLKVWDVKTGHALLTLKGHTLGVTFVAYSPDRLRTRIISGSRDRTLKVWEAEKGQEVLSLKGVEPVAFSPDGKRLLIRSFHDESQEVWDIKVLDTENVQEVRMLNVPPDAVSRFAFAPDGGHLFAWNEAKDVVAWSLVTGQPVDPTDAPPMPDPGPARSPDGHLEARLSGGFIEVVDLRRVNPKVNQWPLPDVAERNSYHSDKAARAEKEKQWFAVAFHVGRLLLDDPDNAELKKRRDEALRKHDPEKPVP